MFSIPYTFKMYKILNGIKKNDPDNLAKINDIYFSLDLPSARNINLNSEEKEELKKIKKEFPDIKLHLIFNPNVVSNDFYFEENLNKFIETILDIKKEYKIDLITINNTILLKSFYLREILKELNIDIKNSVNNNVDTLEKVKIFHKDFQINNIILDRSLNRNEDELLKIINYKKENPEIKLTLLLNEGCLPNCQYKQFCDNMISQYHKNTPEEVQHLTLLHDELTCTADFKNNPELALKSPFISPLYIEYYRKLGIDYFKIAGRGKEKWILENIINFYLKESGGLGHSQNFGFNLFFSTYRPKGYRNIDFNMLEEFNYFENTKNCKLQCHSCDYCDTIFEKLKKL